MNKKSLKFRLLVPALVMGLALTATLTTSATTALASSTKTLKVALVTPSAVNDLAFSEAMVNALDSMQASYNLKVSITDNEFVVADAADAIRKYASEGYNLVIANGSQYGSTLQQLAPSFPKVSFAWGTAGSTYGEPNIYAYEAESNQGGYVQGYMAAMLSKSHTIGIIGPIDVGDAQLYCDGFKAGVLAEDKKATVHESFTGSFSDVTLMATAAGAYVADKADVLTGSSQSVVGAIGVAKTDHVLWFGTQWNQDSLAPSEVVSSQEYNWVPVLRQIVAGVRSGILGGATYDIALGNNGERIVYNPKYPLPANVKAEGLKLTKEIIDGSLTVAQ